MAKRQYEYDGIILEMEDALDNSGEEFPDAGEMPEIHNEADKYLKELPKPKPKPKGFPDRTKLTEEQKIQVDMILARKNREAKKEGRDISFGVRGPPPNYSTDVDFYPALMTSDAIIVGVTGASPRLEGFVDERTNNKFLFVNSDIVSDYKNVIAHEFGHQAYRDFLRTPPKKEDALNNMFTTAMDNMGNTIKEPNEAFPFISQRETLDPSNKEQATRLAKYKGKKLGAVMTGLIKEKAYIESRYGPQNAYFTEGAMSDYSPIRLFEEQLASMAAIEMEHGGIDITADPHLRKTVFADKYVREAYRSLMPDRVKETERGGRSLKPGKPKDLGPVVNRSVVDQTLDFILGREPPEE